MNLVFFKGGKKQNGKKKQMKLASELSKLVNYCKAVHFYDFAKSKQEAKFYEMSSFGENKTKKFIKEKSSDFIEYNKRQLSRIYPAGSRVDSSNYNPFMAWSSGCQIGKAIYLQKLICTNNTNALFSSLEFFGSSDHWFPMPECMFTVITSYRTLLSL